MIRLGSGIIFDAWRHYKACKSFAHDAYLYKTPDAIIQHWQSEQYSYILVYERGREFLSNSASYKFTPAIQKILQETLGESTLAGQTPDKVYSIYQIP